MPRGRGTGARPGRLSSGATQRTLRLVQHHEEGLEATSQKSLHGEALTRQACVLGSGAEKGAPETGKNQWVSPDQVPPCAASLLSLHVHGRGPGRRLTASPGRVWEAGWTIVTKIGKQTPIFQKSFQGSGRK